MQDEMTVEEWRARGKPGRSAKQRGKDYKADLEQALRAAGLPEPVRELRFAKPARQWEFDYCWPDRKIALEYEGLSWASEDGKSRHTSLTGYTGDCEKYSTAAILGWCVVRVTAPMVTDGRALALVLRAFERKV